MEMAGLECVSKESDIVPERSQGGFQLREMPTQLAEREEGEEKENNEGDKKGRREGEGKENEGDKKRRE